MRSSPHQQSLGTRRAVFSTGFFPPQNSGDTFARLTKFFQEDSERLKP